MRYLVLFLCFLFLGPVSSFAQIAPGESCSPNGVSATTSSGGNSHWMVCQGGTWQAVFSHNSAGAITKLGNQTCANGQILKFNGTSWACSADDTAALPALTSAQIWVGNASNTAAAVTLSGDATLSNAGALTIANNAVTNAKIANATIVATTKLSATGTKNNTTFLRGDNTWAVPPGGGVPACVQRTASGGGSVSVSCTAGQTMTGGGCNRGGNITSSGPSAATNTWNCSGAGSATVYAICCTF